MGLIYGEFPETAARLILSAALRKLRQLAKRLFIDERFALAAWMSKPAPFFRV